MPKEGTVLPESFEPLRQTILERLHDYGEPIEVKGDGDQAGVVVITMLSRPYSEGNPVQITISAADPATGMLTLSDEGRTSDFAGTIDQKSSGPESLDFYLDLYKLTAIRRRGVALTAECAANGAELHSTIDALADACRWIAMSIKVSKEIDESRQEKKRAEREARELKSFRLKSRDEVARFDRRLREYVADRARRKFDQLSLGDAYYFLRHRPDRTGSLRPSWICSSDMLPYCWMIHTRTARGAAFSAKVRSRTAGAEHSRRSQVPEGVEW